MSKNKYDHIDLANNITLRFKCEQDSEGEFLDTEVKINGNLLCFITWADVEKFKKEIKSVIDKYKI